ncbi:MAG: V-type ATP synthase subunit D [Caldilineales bacterium]|nr:V-type ATP synthase subunit D [Caldilineales bacterium]MDW8317064.1 V-type ATP synthase subunit D [Anaerolineae bacterium]
MTLSTAAGDPITPTRMELLARRSQLELAAQGRDLLKEKRNALLKELRKVADLVMTSSEVLERAAAESARLLAQAEALDGPEAVRSAALAAAADLSLQVRTVTVMGVTVPEIEHQPVTRSLTARGYSLDSTSARIDAVAESFERQLDLLLELATSELRLRRLAVEVGKTTRRVNALEHVLIPRLRRQIALIEMALEEREREDHVRLKRVKARLARRNSSQAPEAETRP